jgi:hypothetical protein
MLVTVNVDAQSIESEGEEIRPTTMIGHQGDRKIVQSILQCVKKSNPETLLGQLIQFLKVEPLVAIKISKSALQSEMIFQMERVFPEEGTKPRSVVQSALSALIQALLALQELEDSLLASPNYPDQS